MAHEIKRCRICGSSELTSLINLGEQSLTGIFPKRRDAFVATGPLELVRCSKPGCCGLVQLGHSFPAEQLYGATYGYRSGLNRGMINHLRSIASELQQKQPLSDGDIVLDIGANDGTSLSFYPRRLTLIGMDPSAEKFRKYYRDDIQILIDFFTADAFLKATDGRKAKIITSIAMFYDLETPQMFVDYIAKSLADDGLWFFEQSYLPLMLEATAYDTICHEHSEYYTLSQIEYMLNRSGLDVVDVVTNDTNGGSFAVTAAKRGSRHSISPNVEAMRQYERNLNVNDPAAYVAFSQRVHQHAAQLSEMIHTILKEGKRIVGYGASTKGNVLLQYCGITAKELPCIAEVNEDKFGSFTPGTLIPIVSEAEAKALKPDYMMVLPWHFRNETIRREAAYLQSGGKLLFPLPVIEVFPPDLSV
jgi:hypothetical protein